MNPVLTRMIIDTFLKGHRQDILDSMNSAVEFVEGFDQRFRALEDSIALLVKKQQDNNLKGELLGVLEDLKNGTSLEDALDDSPVLDDDADTVKDVQNEQ